MRSSEAFRLISRAHEHKCSGNVLKVVGKIFATHADFGQGDVVSANDLFKDGPQKCYRFGPINDGWVANLIIELCRCSKGLGRKGDDTAQVVCSMLCCLRRPTLARCRSCGHSQG